MSEELQILIGMLAGVAICGLLGVIIGTILSDRCIWKRSWKESLTFWRL